MLRYCQCVARASRVQHVQYMDFDYHDSFRRLVLAYKDNERETCEALMQSSESLVEQTKNLNLENDLHYFLSEYSNSFSAPNYFQFTSFQGDDVSFCDNFCFSVTSFSWCFR